MQKKKLLFFVFVVIVVVVVVVVFVVVVVVVGGGGGRLALQKLEKSATLVGFLPRKGLSSYLKMLLLTLFSSCLGKYIIYF